MLIKKTNREREEREKKKFSCGSRIIVNIEVNVCYTSLLFCREVGRLFDIFESI